MSEQVPTYAPDVKEAANALRAGRFAQAQRQISQILEVRPDDVDALNLKTAALNMRGAYSEALLVAERAVSLRRKDLRLTLNLAAILNNLGRREDALNQFNAALAISPDDVRALHERGRVLLALNRAKDAKPDFERAVELSNKLGELRTSLAEALLMLGDASAAQLQLAEAARLGDRSARRHTIEARCAVERADYQAARTAFEAAIERDPAPIYPYTALVEVERRLGAAAQPAIDRALRQAPVALREDGKPEARILVLERFGRDSFSSLSPSLHPHASGNFICQAPAGRLSFMHAFVNQPMSASAARAAFQDIDVIYNNCATAEALDVAANGALQRIIAEAGEKPVVNTPAAVANSARAANAAAYENAKEFVFPKTIELREPGAEFSLLDEAALYAARRDKVLATLQLPVILRPRGTHKGSGAQLVETEDALLRAIESFGPIGVYAIEYHDCGVENEPFRRYRFAVVGTAMAPSNMHVASHWNVHGSERDAFDWEGLGLGAAERQFLEAPDVLLGAAPEIVFAPILERTELDIYGIDFGVRRSDGRIVVFEVNSAMLFSSVSLAQRFPYLWPHRNDLNTKIEEFLLARAQRV